MIKEEPIDIIEEPIIVKTEPTNEDEVDNPLVETGVPVLVQIKQRPRYCNVYGCLVNTAAYPALTFFTLPEDKDRRMEWLKHIDRTDLIDRTNVNVYICEKHFRHTDLISTPMGKLLKRSTVPTLAETAGVPAITDKALQITPSTSSNHTQTESPTQVDAAAQADLQTADDLKKQISTDLRKSRKRLKLIETELETRKKENFHAACDHFLSPHLAELIKGQTDLKGIGKGNRYHLAQRIFSLNLFCISPEVYCMLEKDLCLPSVYRLKRMDIPITTYFSNDLLAAFKMKVQNMTEREKYCVVAVDMTKIKSNLFYNGRQDRVVGFHDIDGVQKAIPAQYALVILVRGLFEDWTQPVAFAFLSQNRAPLDVSAWVDKVLASLLEIGLKIKAYVPKYETKLMDEANIRNISVNQPYFYINNVKIYYIFNVPELLTQLRNYFFTHNFSFKKSDGSVGLAKFEHVRMFYERDATKRLRMAPKLTHRHVQPRGPCRRSVRYAAHIFSRTVATGVATYLQFQEIDESARETVDFLLLINNLFDLLNSSTVSENPYKTAYTGEKDQINLLKGYLKLFETLQLTHAKTEMWPVSADFTMGFQATISAVIQLFQDVQEEGFDSLFTRRLNLDVADNFFRTIRSKRDMTVKPTSHQFVIWFRRLYLAHILKPTKGGNVSSKDLTRLLVQLTDFTDNEEEDEVSGSGKGAQNKLVDKKVTTADFNKLKVSEKDSVRNICTFVLKRCLNVHKDCKKFKMFTKFYESSKYSSHPAVGRFHKSVWFMESEFQSFFDDIGAASASSIYNKVKESTFECPCPCFPTTFFQKMYLRVRIHVTLNYNNKIYRQNKHKGEGFVIPKLVA